MNEITDEGYVNFSIKSTEENQKSLGLTNYLFENDDSNEEENTNIADKQTSVRNKSTNQSTSKNSDKSDFKKIFIENILAISIYEGFFTLIPGFTDSKKFYYRIIVNPSHPVNSEIIDSINPQWRKKTIFKIYMPCFIENIIIEVFSQK